MRLLILTLERNLELEAEHEIRYLDYRRMDEIGLDAVIAEIEEFAPALIIEREFNDGKSRYDALLDHIRKNTRIPTAVWLIDTHCAFKRHKKYAPKFHYVFLAISKFVPKFRKWNPNTFWLPLCFQGRSDALVPGDAPRRYDVSFIGNYEMKLFKNRRKMLEAIRKEFGDRFLLATDYENLLPLLRASRVSFNCSLDEDLNFRVWEVLACTELVTDLVPDIPKIAGLEQRLHAYRKKTDMLEKIHAVLDGSAATDTTDNREWIRHNHCLVHRYRSLLNMVETGIQESF